LTLAGGADTERTSPPVPTSISAEKTPFRWAVLRLGGTAGGLALVAAMALPPSIRDREIGSLALALGESIHGSVLPEDVRWEPAANVAEEYVAGRWAVFLGSDRAGAPRDVWRARVRLSPEGQPLTVEEAHNLTVTPLGDDHTLVVRGRHAAFATFAYGQEQSLTVLDLSGEGDQAKDNVKVTDRAMAAVTNVQQTGTAGGVGRVDVTLDPPAKKIDLTADADGHFAVALHYDDGVKYATFDAGKGEITGAPGLHAEAARHLRKPVVFWAVDTVRAVPWIGPAPIAWLEDQVFALKDTAKQALFKLHGAESTEQLAEPNRSAGGGGGAPAVVLDTSKTSADDGAWPPKRIASVWKTSEPGEGEWAEPKIPWLKRLNADAPPAFVRTFVRPDEERPYVQVLLVALDMRQLDMEMEAGSEDPKPLVGAHGPGRIPRDQPTYSRIVAAFNGGFKTEHGAYGMMVNKRVLIPPMPGAATVAVLADHRVGFGTWANTHEVTGIKDVEDAEILSFRQNLDPLVDRGEVNPTKRGLWGWTMPGTGVQTERSGVCTTNDGHILYAWGDDVSATALGKAMNMAGCAYGLHLDMNPHHTGFLFTAIDELKGRKYKSELLSTQMEIMTDRYIEYAPKDFFYMLLHDPTPAPLAPEAPWRPDPGAQPAPAWLAGIWSTKLEANGSAVDLIDVEPARASYRIRGGSHEPDAATGSTALAELKPEDAARVLFAVTLGVAQEKRPRGLGTSGKLVVPVRGGAGSAVLVADPAGGLSIVKADELSTPFASGDLVELPLLLEGGRVVASDNARSPSASAGGASSRAALGITSSGRVLVARGTFSTDAPLADALRRAGCARAVILDRGARATTRLDRAGTPSPPRASYEESVLYAITRPMKPRAFRFEPQTITALAK
jgi:hypothetical protein